VTIQYEETMARLVRCSGSCNTVGRNDKFSSGGARLVYDIPGCIVVPQDTHNFVHIPKDPFGVGVWRKSCHEVLGVGAGGGRGGGRVGAEMTAEDLTFGGRHSLWLGRGLEKLFLNRPGGFWLPDGTGYVGFGRCFGFVFRGRAVHDRVPLLDGISCDCVLRDGGGAGGG
jgi:hypothetical protein